MRRTGTSALATSIGLSLAFAAPASRLEGARQTPVERPRASSPAPMPPGFEADVRELLRISAARETAGILANAAIEQVLKRSSTLPPGGEQVVAGAIGEVFDRNYASLVDRLVPIYARHFTHDEVKSLLAFHRSPAGRKLAAVGPVLSRETVAASQGWGETIRDQVRTEVLARLKAAGITPTPPATPDGVVSSQPVRVGPNVPPPAKLVNVTPVYPADAQAARIQGVVIIEATIGTDGKVSNARVLKSVPLLDEPALAAVKQWEYEPTRLNGVPVPVIMTVTVNFTLPPPPQKP